METFGQYLAAKRKQAGLSQRELAARVGVSPTYISYLERDINPAARGRPQPSVDLVDRLARALGCPVNEMRLKAGYAPAEQHDAPADFLDRIRVLFYGWDDLSEKDKAEMMTAIEVIAEMAQRRRKERKERKRSRS